MSNNLKTVDTPYFPLTPLPSKRGLLIIVAFIAGFVILLSYYIAGELMNNSVRTPERVEEQVGLPLLSALPDLSIGSRKVINIDEMNAALVQRVINSIFIELKRNKPHAERHVITILSTKNGEGKSYFSQLIASKFAQIKNDVILLYPETSSKSENLSGVKPHHDLQIKEYKVIDKLVDADSITDLIEANNNKPLEEGKHSFVIIELPSLNKYPVPIQILEQSDVSILIVHANKSWTNSDKRILKEFETVRHNQVKVLLNRVVPDLLESIYGEIPKQRSKLRKKMKLIFGGQKY